MKIPEIKITIGVPGSGKSTFAKYWLRTEPNWMRVNRDDYRAMHFSKDNMSWEDENKLSVMIEGAITFAIDKGINVLIDNTHCKAEFLHSIIDNFSNKAHISFKTFDVPLDVLKKRCQDRYEQTGKYIPVKVIEKYFNDFERLKENFDFSPITKKDLKNEIRHQNKDLPKAIICDLDGTLALLNGRNPFDASKCDEDLLNEPVANVLKNYKSLGYNILLVSGREEQYKEPTLRFLEKYAIPFDELLMRKSKDSRKDAIIKTEIYNECIKDQYFIEFVLDDRNQVVDTWRKDLKLPCFQVFYGDF